MNSAIIVAAGKSERMGSGTDKAFLSLGSRPVLAYSVMAFEACTDVDEVVLVVRKEKLIAARGMARMFGCSKLRAVVAGGRNRQDSVAAGLEALGEDSRIVVVHDGARPMISPELISSTIKTAKRSGSAVAARKITDTVKYVERGLSVDHTIDRNHLWASQTPQAFKTDLLRKAYARIVETGTSVTDESAALELIGEKVRLVENEHPNVKITTSEDLNLAAVLMGI